jgi:hypothetical protein
LHNRIIRVVAERCNQKIKGLFKIQVELVIIQAWNIKRRNSKIPASSCYHETEREPNAKMTFLGLHLQFKSLHEL